MAAPQRDPAEVVRGLCAWFEAERGFTDVEIANVSIPGNTGFSNETIFFVASWSDEVRRCGVTSWRASHRRRIRCFPTTRSRSSSTSCARSPQGDVPMVAVHWFERDESWFGRPFWIMDRVDGLIASDNPPYAAAGWLADASPRTKRGRGRAGSQPWPRSTTLRSTISRDHLVVPDNPIAAEIDRYERFLRLGRGRPAAPLARDAIAWLRGNRPPAPASGPALVWGDARLSNVVYRDFEVAAVLDWEMAIVGDPLLDLGWWIFSDETLTCGVGFERLPGFECRRRHRPPVVGAHRSSDRRARLLPGLRRVALHRDHGAHGQVARRHGARPADVSRTTTTSARDSNWQFARVRARNEPVRPG